MQPENESYGAAVGSLSTLQKIRMLVDWAPLLSLAEAVSKAEGNQAKALAIVELLRWLSKKTSTETDDKVIDSLAAILKSPEGAAIVNFLVSLAGAIK